MGAELRETALRDAETWDRGTRERGTWDRELWDRAVEFHGHECPGLAIGFKACEAVMEKMGIGVSDDEQIVCVTENDACGVDAVQAILSCTFGKGNLLYRDTAKQAFTFFDRNTGKALRFYLKKRNEGMERAEFLQFLLESPVDELFTISEPTFALPEMARLFTTVFCARCSEGAAERSMRLEGGEPVCADCFTPYNRGW